MNPTPEQYASLKTEHDRLKQILDLAPMAFYVCDEDLRILMSNRRLAEFFGLSIDEIVGQKLDDLLHPESAETSLANARAALESDKPVHTEEESHIDAEGGRHFFEFYDIPFRDPENGRRCILGVAHNITERKQSERMAHDLHIAREIQRGLLPVEQPTIEGFEIAGWNQAADETGGDYFDWLPLPDGRTVISIADATGHGIGPALITTVCRAYFRASCSFETSLERTFTRVNKLLSNDLPPGRFVTAAAAILEPKRRHLQLFSAGHGPTLFYRAASGDVQSFPADALPLGIMADDTKAPSREILFQPGDCLVLITDGFFEWRNENRELFGLRRLEHAICRNSHLHAKEMITAIYEEVLAFAGNTEPDDDLTAVIIKCT